MHGAIIIFTVILSAYFAGSVQAESTAGGPPLNLYHLGPENKIIPATENFFLSGEKIWVAFPTGQSPPYTLVIEDEGKEQWSQRGDSAPADNLLLVSLAPYILPPNHSYQVLLQTRVQTSPGLYKSQTSIISIYIIPNTAHFVLVDYSRQSGMDTAKALLLDSRNIPVTGVRLALMLHEASISIQLASESTDLDGEVSFQVGETLAPGRYFLETKVLDSNAVLAQPLQLPEFAITTVPTRVVARMTSTGVQADLRESTLQRPVQGRLMLLEEEMKDGNWTVSATSFTDSDGRVQFPKPSLSNIWRVSFKGDTFFSPSFSGNQSNSTITNKIDSPVSEGVQWSTFVGNTFSNGHITLKIGPAESTIYDPEGQFVLGHLHWEVQVKDGSGSWQSLPWDGPLSATISNSSGLHQVILQGTAGNGEVYISQSFLARPVEALYTPLRMPVDIEALRGSNSYRLVWHLDTVSAAFFKFERRTDSQRTTVGAPIAAGTRLDQLASGENSLVVLASNGETVLFGLNWDSASQFYLGTSLDSGMSGATANVQFGGVSLSSGQHWIIPACPCPDGGGGGGGPLATTTTLSLPSSTYATIAVVLKAQVKESPVGTPIAGLALNFYRDGSLLGTGTTNSTGWASLAWTPGMTGSHSINATFLGNCCFTASSFQQSLTISQTPTTTMILKPSPIAFSWDLYNYYSGNGLPIVVPVTILALAPSGTGSSASIYMPSYNGNSTSPPRIAGYGWAGLNQTSAVTIVFNSTYTQTQSMNWTRNFYLPPCPNPPNCTTSPRTGHMYLTASLLPPSTLYSPSSSSLSIPYQNVNSLTNAALMLTPRIDGSAIANCQNTTSSCRATLTTTHNNDVIIAFLSETLDLYPSCSFSISDTSLLTWSNRTRIVYGRYDGNYQDQFQEFWARSSSPLSSDVVTESIIGCATEYNGLQVFGVSGADFNNPFDSSPGVPGIGSDSTSGQQSVTTATVSTASPGDMLFAGAQHGTSAVPAVQSGFTMITSAGGAGTEYEIASSTVSNLGVTFTFSTSSYWQMIADALKPGIAMNQSAVPPQHLYVNVNASYPYISVQMQGLPVALAAYVAYLAYNLQQSPPASVQCNNTCNVYNLPVLSPTQGSDFAYACLDTNCASVAANTSLYLYNSQGQYCTTTTTDYSGVAHLNIAGPFGCTYPYYYLETTSTQVIISGLYAIEAVSNPVPFYTNFQGYNYATYAPQRTGGYLLHMHTYYTSSSYTILYPNGNYPDVKQPYFSCCDVFLNVEKHPLVAQAIFNPGTPTILDKTNATIQWIDAANNKPLISSAFNYTVTQTNAGSITEDGVASAQGPTNVPCGTSTNVSLSLTTSLPNDLIIVYVMNNCQTVNSISDSKALTWNTRVNALYGDLYVAEYWAWATTGLSSDQITVNSNGDTIIAEAIAYTDVLHSSPFDGGPYVNYFASRDCTSPGNCGCTASLTNLSQGTSDMIVGMCSGYGQSNTGWAWAAPSGFTSQVSTSHVAIPVQNGFEGTNSAEMIAHESKPCSQDSCSFLIPMFYTGPVPGTVINWDIIGEALRQTATATPLSGSLTTNSNGTALIPLGNLAHGNYTLTLSRSATPTLNAVSTSIAFTVYKAKPTLIITPSWVQNAIAGQTSAFTTSLANNSTRTLIGVSGLVEKVYVNSGFYGLFLTNSGGNATFSWTPATAGQYNITVAFPQQSYFTPSSVVTMVSVAHRTVILAVTSSPPGPNVNQQVTWNVLAYDLINNATVKSLQLNQYIDGSPSGTLSTDNTGTAIFKGTFSSPGPHNVTFVSVQNATYSSGSLQTTVTALLATSLALRGGTSVVLGQQNAFTITLNDANGNPLVSRKIQISVNGAFYQNVSTNGAGQAQFSWRPDNAGSYDLVASFTPAGPGDFIYRASSGELTVKVQPAITVNIQTTSSGTQSISLSTAQGSTQPSIPPPSISVQFPDPFTMTLSIQYNGRTGQASSHLANIFGWNCYWWGCLPYWNVRITASVTGVLDYTITGAALGGATGVKADLYAPPPEVLEAFNTGLEVSTGIGASAVVTTTATIESGLGPIAGGTTVLSAIPVAAAAGAALGLNGDTSPYKSYLLGLIIAPLFAIPCIIGECPEIPESTVLNFGGAMLPWILFELEIAVLWADGGWIAALETAIAFLLPALMLTLLP